jgi:hypothetical protein
MPLGGCLDMTKQRPTLPYKNEVRSAYCVVKLLPESDRLTYVKHFSTKNSHLKVHVNLDVK